MVIQIVIVKNSNSKTNINSNSNRNGNCNNCNTSLTLGLAPTLADHVGQDRRPDKTWLQTAMQLCMTDFGVSLQGPWSEVQDV